MKKLKKLRKQWVSDLRKYPERQLCNSLGYINDVHEIRACCLGQLLITECEVNKRDYKTILFDNVVCDSGENWINRLQKSYKRLGLRGPLGQLKEGTVVKIKNNEILRSSNNLLISHLSLATLNDREECTWPMIADFIEKNPSVVFVDVEDDNYFKN